MVDGDLYPNYKKLQLKHNLETLNKHFHLVQLQPEGNDEIIDFGCGDGEVSVEILLSKFPKKSQKLLGCDISEKMIKLANKNYEKNRQVSFMTLDISTKAFPKELENRFHHAFSFFCLQWVIDQEQAIKNIYNSLKPGGDFTLIVVAPNLLFNIYKDMTEVGKWTEYVQDYEKVFSPYYYNNENPIKDVQTLLENAGFSVSFCTKAKHAYAYKDEHELKYSMLALSPFTSRIPKNEIENYWKDRCKSMEKVNFLVKNADDNEKLTIQYYEVFAFATKPLT